MMESMAKMKEMVEISIFEVFEKMFYIFLEPESGQCPGYDMESVIGFSGSINGEVRLLFSEKITKVMVQNMLNLEEGDITDIEMDDCAKEAVNMICGNFLVKLDERERFDLTIPVFMKPPESDPYQDSEVIRLDFISDDGGVGMVMGLSQGVSEQ